ncbi:MAG: hypothetical protein ABW096_09045 [Candidatus Thiodiazotropha sp.]
MTKPLPGSLRPFVSPKAAKPLKIGCQAAIELQFFHFIPNNTQRVDKRKPDTTPFGDPGGPVTIMALLLQTIVTIKQQTEAFTLC